MAKKVEETEAAYETPDRIYGFMEMPSEYVMSVYDTSYMWQESRYFPKAKYKTLQEAVKAGMLEKGKKINVEELWKKLDKKKS